MSYLNNRGWNSRNQNKALSEWKELVSLIVCMYADGDVADAICRNRYSPGVKKPRVPGELGEMEGTPPPAYGKRRYGDPVGEDACWPDEIDDVIDRKVRAMVRTIGHVLNTARWMKEQSARRTVELEAKKYLETVCQACRTGGHPRLIRSYCRSCYDRWVYLRRPNRITFELERRAELGIPEIPTADSEAEPMRTGLSEEIPTPMGSMVSGEVCSEIELSAEGSPGQLPSSFAPPAPSERNDKQHRRAQ